MRDMLLLTRRDRRLAPIASKDNYSDLHPKGLERLKHVYFTTSHGIISRSSFLNLASGDDADAVIVPILLTETPSMTRTATVAFLSR